MPIILDANGKPVVPVLSLSEYFSQDFVLRIPEWQREYTWRPEDEGEIGDLLNDLKEFTENPAANEYLLGSTILCLIDGDSKSRNVIDGQQRSVTLTLFFMASMKILLSRKNQNLDGDYHLLSDLEKLYQDGGKWHVHPRLTFSQPNADIIMKKIMGWVKNETEDENSSLIEEQDDHTATQKNLLNSIKYIYKQINEGKWLSEESLPIGLEKIMRSVKLVQITLDSEPEAIQVFDRINNRGMKLSDADLLKNLLFRNVTDSKFSIVSENWLTMSENLRSIKANSKLQDPKYLLRAHAWAKYPVKTTYDGLVDKFKNEGEIQDEAKALNFSETLVGLSGSLASFASCVWPESHRLPHLFPAQFLGSVQHYPILLAGMKIKNEIVRERLSYLVGARTVLYVLSQQRPPEFEGVVLKLSNAILSAGANLSLEDLNGIFLEHGTAPEAMVKQMRTNIANWDVKKSADKKKIRASLAYMSWWLDAISHNLDLDIQTYFTTRKPRGQKHGWDIDHTDPSKSDSGLSDALKNSIGNLVLLHPTDNRSAKNAPPSAKKTDYSQSKLLLTKSSSALELTANFNNKLADLYNAIGVNPVWDMENWSKASIDGRRDFYIAFLEAMLTGKLTVPQQH